MDAVATLVPIGAPDPAAQVPGLATAPVELAHADPPRAGTGAAAPAPDPAGLALVFALAELGDIDLPTPALPPRNALVLASLPLLYWAHGLDRAGLFTSAERVAGLWASGAIQIPLADHGVALQQYWAARRERLSAPEREHLLGLVFDARDFEPAMGRLCQSLVALADNAGLRDLREEVGLEHAAQAVLELCAARLQGPAQLAAPELLAQARAAVQLLSQRPLQAAFGVPDFYAFLALGRAQPGAGGGLGMGAGAAAARRAAEQAQAGAAVLRWLAQAAAQRFAIDPREPALQSLIAQAQRWLMSAGPAAGALGLGPSPGAWALDHEASHARGGVGPCAA